MSKQDKTIIKGNALLESRYKFSLLEMKLTLSVLAQIKRKDEAFKEYRVYVDDIKDLIQTKGDIYTYMKDVCRRLKGKNVEIETETGHLQTSYFSDIETYKGRGYIDFSISEKMKPYLLQLKSEFTVYDIRNILRCKSVASIRIYQLMKQYEKLGERTIEIKTLKHILGFTETQYTRWSNFKVRIIDAAKKELMKYSDLYFDYTINKKGHFVHSITFHIKKQKQRRLFDGQDYIKNDEVIQLEKMTEKKLAYLKEQQEDSISIPDELKNRIG